MKDVPDCVRWIGPKWSLSFLPTQTLLRIYDSDCAVDMIAAHINRTDHCYRQEIVLITTYYCKYNLNKKYNWKHKKVFD